MTLLWRELREHRIEANHLSIVDSRHPSEPLLAGDIPELEANTRPAGWQVQQGGREVDSDGASIVVAEHVGGEPVDEGGLAHPGIADHNHLQPRVG